VRARGATFLICVALLLGGCGDASGKPVAGVTSFEAAAPAEGGHNDTDVMYLQMMLAHHRQGLEMVKLAEQRASRPELVTLAKAIDVTQSDEVRMMTGWLERWSRPTTVDQAPSAHAAHGGLPATGPREIAALRAAQGAAFETAFLNLFVAHQHNAVEMAHLESTQGSNQETKAFADRVRQSRADQIKQLLTLMNA
jgi:uncharacterized protein (DUF305 family)